MYNEHQKMACPMDPNCYHIVPIKFKVFDWTVISSRKLFTDRKKKKLAHIVKPLIHINLKFRIYNDKHTHL